MDPRLDASFNNVTLTYETYLLLSLFAREAILNLSWLLGNVYVVSIVIFMERLLHYVAVIIFWMEDARGHATFDYDKLRFFTLSLITVQDFTEIFFLKV